MRQDPRLQNALRAFVSIAYVRSARLVLGHELEPNERLALVERAHESIELDVIYLNDLIAALVRVNPHEAPDTEPMVLDTEDL